MKTSALAVAAASVLLAAPSAGAKDFRPGDLRVCSATRCVPIVRREVLPSIGRFYYTGAQPRRVRRPALGTPYYELRTPNGYVTGIVGTRRLDRFLTYGVHDGRFEPHVWYAVPVTLSEELRRLTRRLRPLALSRAALARSR
jgi:hypothetical protein